MNANRKSGAMPDAGGAIDKTSVEVEREPISPLGKLVYKIDDTPSETLVIHCADPRFQTAFRRFITEELGLKNYTPIVVGGGIHALSSQTFLPKNFKILWEQVKFYIKEGKIRRIIFINHADCKWYEKIHGHLPRIDLPIKGQQDLRTAAEIILHDFAGVHLETYFAHLDGNEVTFERVT